jgi:hypothetical protein
MSGCRSAGGDVVGVVAGPADAGDPVEGRFPGDGLVDAGSTAPLCGSPDTWGQPGTRKVRHLQSRPEGRSSAAGRSQWSLSARKGDFASVP